MLKPHIVILGAGFGGTYVAKKLVPLVMAGKIDVTIVNQTNYFLFTPLLHEVATGSLTAGNVAEPLREIFKGTGIQLCQGKIKSVNGGNRQVTVSGTTEASLHYDYLVVATGAETNYYNIPGADTYALPLKNLSDAINIRAAVIESFEKAVYDMNPRERLKQLSFVVVGGGATGVELAAELSEFVREIVKRYYADTNRCKSEEPTVSLVHAGNELLEMFPPPLRKAALDRLTKNKVLVHLNTAVVSINQHGLVLANNSTLQSSTVIWTAGVKPSIPFFEDGMPPLVAGRLPVDEFFGVGGSDRVFALGDVAAYIDHAQNEGKPHPMLAQVTVQQASVVARNLIAAVTGKEQKTFKYHSLGSLVSVGQWFAIGTVLGVNLSGKFTWWLWRTVYLFKFASWKKRTRIVIDWTLDVFYPRDITIK